MPFALAKTLISILQNGETVALIYMLNKPENSVYVFVIKDEVKIGRQTLRKCESLSLRDAESFKLVVSSNTKNFTDGSADGFGLMLDLSFTGSLKV